MGLNMNYRFFAEGFKTNYHIPEYNSYYKSSQFSIDRIAENVVSFNRKVNDARLKVTKLIESEDDSSSDSTTIINGIKDEIDSVVKAVNDVYGNIMEFSDNTLNSLSEYKSSFDDVHTVYEKIAVLRKMLDSPDYHNCSIRVGSIIPSKELTDGSYPDTSVIGKDLVEMVTVLLDKYCTNVKDSNIGNDFTYFIENNKNNMIRTALGDYLPHELTWTSSVEVASNMFGKTNRRDMTFNLDLYMMAGKNLSEIDTAIACVDSMKSKCKKDFDSLTLTLDNMGKSILNFDKITKINNEQKEDYYKYSRIVIDRIDRVINVIQKVVNIISNIINIKLTRINDIYGDSKRINDLGNELINNHFKSYFKLDDSDNQEKEYNGEDFNDSEEAYIQNEYNEFVNMMEDALMEQEFHYDIMMAISEAENDNNNNAVNNTASNIANTAKKAMNAVKDGSLMEWVKEMISQFGNTVERFKARIEELVIKNVDGKTFWDKNKAAISKLTLTDTKVNQWFKYNLDTFSKSTYVKFDVNSDDIKSDEAMQNAIIRKLTSNPPAAADNESFKDRINKIFQGEYVDDKNGDGQPLANVGYDHDSAYTFIDDFIDKGFNGSSLGNIEQDRKNIDKDFKDVSRNYEQLVEQRKANNSEQNAQNKANNADNNSGTPQNASAMLANDFKFNLAEHFGLINHEASFTVGQNDSQSATAVGGGDQNNTRDKELDDMIKRCFRYNTIAITAKMTCVVSAYKQYMGLFKAVYNGKKKSNNTNTANNNKNNNNQNNNK